jgi:putative transcriptional regulator
MLVVMMFASTMNSHAWTLTVASRNVCETRSQNLLYRTAPRRRLQMTPDSDDITAQEDWRDFRARLVAREHKHFSDKVDTWYVYELGDVIEEGSVILSRHEHDFCYGLKQQYFHKSIMLVLEHEENLMTNGILLNRPMSRIITDEYNNSWSVWYGGPVRGIHDDIDSSQGEQLAWTCLHSLTNPVAKRLSNQIIKDIKLTTLETAQFLVENGRAVPNCFTVYCGFASWGPGYLQRELQ